MLVSRFRARISSSGFCDRGLAMRGGHSSTDRDDRHRVGPRRAAATVTARRSRAAPARPISGAVFPSRENARLAGQLEAARVRIAELKSELARASSRDPISSQLLTLRTPSAPSSSSTSSEPSATGARSRSPCSTSTASASSTSSTATGPATWCSPRVGGAITAAIRTNDLACRVGGDEFAIMFPETDAAGAHEAVERILGRSRDVEAGGVRGHSASAGVAALEPGQTPEACSPPRPRRSRPARAGGGGHAAVFATADGDPIDADALAGVHGDVIAALASALGERDRYTGDHSESVVDLAARVGESLALDPAQSRRAANGGAAARHRQGRGPRRDPAQARSARRARVGDHAPAPGDRRADHPRDPGDGRDRSRGPPRARALGRQRLSRRARGRADPDRGDGSSSPATHTTRWSPIAPIAGRCHTARRSPS